MRRTKVALITSKIAPYRIPLFNKLDEVPGVQWKVFTLVKSEPHRQWHINSAEMEFDHQLLQGWNHYIWRWEFAIHLNWGLWRELRRYNPDAVITSGYDALAYWEAFFYCKLFKKKYILWNGTTLLSTGRTSGFIGKLKRIMIKRADQYVAYGTKAAEYLEYMGAPKERIHVGINTVDMDWYRKQASEVRGAGSFASERSKYPRILVLYVGQLIKRKGVKQVLKALNNFNDPEIGLLIVGNGPQEEELKKFCADQGLRNVYFEGFQQQNALPQYYALADVLILASFREVWGLVVNEALASGLYVLCSNQAGAAYDLIKEGWNGAMFDPRNVEELAMLIQQTKVHIDEIRARREAISDYACSEFSIARSAKAFRDAIRSLHPKSWEA